MSESRSNSQPLIGVITWDLAVIGGFSLLLCLGCDGVFSGAGLEAPPMQEGVRSAQVVAAGQATLTAQVTLDEIPIQGKGQAGYVKRLQMTSLGFVLVDGSTKSAYEYSFEGQHLRSYSAEELRDLTICDTESALGYSRESELLVYGKELAPLTSWGARFGVRPLVCGGSGDPVLIRRADGLTIPVITRYDRATHESLFATTVGVPANGILTCGVGHLFHMVYDADRERIYYLGPGESHVRELDAATGEIIRTFGQEIPTFKPLPKKYEGSGCGTMAEAEAAIDSTTHPINMVLVKGRYLMVGFANLMDEHAVWQIYDLQSGPAIQMYSLSPSDAVLLKRQPPMAARDAEVFILERPEKEERFSSYGRLRSYTLEVPSGVN